VTLSRFLRVSHQRVRSLLRRDVIDGEVARELAFHFDQLVAEHVADGATIAEARRLARRSLGNVTALREECRDQRRVSWLQDVWQDVFYALRLLRRSPGFAFVATVSLAIGIGANAATLAAINHVLLTSLPFPDAGRLVMLRTYAAENPGQLSAASRPEFVAWREARAFASIGASIGNQRDLGIDGDPTQSERLVGFLFTPGVFEALGVAPQLGRVFSIEDASQNSRLPVVVISHGLWLRRFGADPEILRKPVRINGVQTTVLGVMPAGFTYPAAVAEYWAPFVIAPTNVEGSARLFQITARLKSGVTLEQAQTEMDAIMAQLAREAPDSQRGWAVRVQELRDAKYGWATAPLMTVQAAVALLLLIGCVNVAGLLCARGVARTPEIAIRAALGAGRGRILRQLFVDSLVLSTFAAGLGVLVAMGVLAGLARLVPPPAGFPLHDIDLDLPVLALTVLLAVVVTAAVGAVPAFISARTNLRHSFSQPSPARLGSVNTSPLWGLHSAVQLALALIVLVGAGLVARSFLRLAERDLNFEPRGLVMFDVVIPIRDYARQIGLHLGFPYFEIHTPPSLVLDRVHERLAAIPGVDSIAGLSFPPINSFIVPEAPIAVTGPQTIEAASARSPLRTSYFLATRDLVTTMGAMMVAGRDFTAEDRVSSPWVAIVNETAAKRFWPDANPIGHTLRIQTVPEELPRTVVGVVRDIPLRRTDTRQDPVVYVVHAQQAPRYRAPFMNLPGRMTFLVRATRDPISLAPAIRQTLQEVAPERSVGTITSVENYAIHPLPQRAYYLLVLAAFAATATLLAAIGVYGVTSYSVAQRTHEIGIRLALGARPHDVVVLAGRNALATIAIGLAVGLAVALGATRLIAAQLWTVTPTDPVTFITVSVLLAAVALIASWIPVRRALRVDPTIALKCE
jgi:putative ABC transport system permease protein